MKLIWNNGSGSRRQLLQLQHVPSDQFSCIYASLILLLFYIFFGWINIHFTSTHPHIQCTCLVAEWYTYVCTEMEHPAIISCCSKQYDSISDIWMRWMSWCVLELMELRWQCRMGWGRAAAVDDDNLVLLRVVAGQWMKLNFDYRMSIWSTSEWCLKLLMFLWIT